MKVLLSVVMTLLFFSELIKAEGGDDVKTIFQQGTEYFQKSQLADAKAAFLKSVNAPRYRFSSLYNLGNVAFREGKLGEAIAYYKQAQQLKPRDADLAANLSLSLNTLKVKALPGPSSTWETFRQSFLNRLTIDEFLVCSFVLGALFSLGLINFLKLRKQSKLGLREQPKTTFPFVLTSLALFLWLTLTVFKLIDSLTPRATVVAAKVQARSGPNENYAPLYDLFEGLEVIVEETHNDWYQVTYPGGLTGWIPKNAALMSGGKSLW